MGRACIGLPTARTKTSKLTESARARPDPRSARDRRGGDTRAVRAIVVLRDACEVRGPARGGPARRSRSRPGPAGGGGRRGRTGPTTLAVPSAPSFLIDTRDISSLYISQYTSHVYRCGLSSTLASSTETRLLRGVLGLARGAVRPAPSGMHSGVPIGGSSGGEPEQPCGTRDPQRDHRTGSTLALPGLSTSRLLRSDSADPALHRCWSSLRWCRRPGQLPAPSAR